MIDLAAELPRAVLADLLNLHPTTAVKWMLQAGGDWTRYAAELARTRNHQPWNNPNRTMITMTYSRGWNTALYQLRNDGRRPAHRRNTRPPRLGVGQETPKSPTSAAAKRMRRCSAGDCELLTEGVVTTRPRIA